MMRNNTHCLLISGSVFVTKIASGTKYNFAFSDKIPDLNGVEFEKKGDNTLVSVGEQMNYLILELIMLN